MKKHLVLSTMLLTLLALSACGTPPSCRGITSGEKLKYALEGPLFGNLFAANAAERHKVDCVNFGAFAAE